MKSMQTQTKSRIYLIFSMAIFGTLAPFVRNISVSSGELALYRALLAILLIGAFLLLTKQKIEFCAIRRELPLLLISGAAMGLNWILLFEAYKYTTVATATLSYYFAPVLVTVVCPLLFHTKMTKKQILCFVMSTIGLVMIVGVGKTSGDSDFIGILFGLGAACLYATVMILNKFIKGVAGIPRTFLQFVSAAIVLIPYVALSGGVTLGSLDGLGWGALLTVGLIHSGIAYCLYFSSFEHLRGEEVALLSYVDPLVAIFVGVFALGEAMTPWQIVGGLLILGFTLLCELPTPKKRTKNNT